MYSKTLLAAVLAVSADGFAFIPKNVAHTAPASKSVLNMSIGLYYSTSTGNTETVAGYIAEAVGGLEPEDIGDASDDEITGHDSLIVGAPTWHTGAETERSGTSWDDWLYNTLPNLDLDGKKVAVFGCGDQDSYSDNYCDAAGELYDLFEAKGCKIFGLTSTDGFNHEESKAERDGKFVGAMFDEDNQYDLSEDRAQAWIAQLKEEGFM
uniref:Flavodoxin-like domain-containing protein n=1 Tax=Corethron hystrix TaxID=216773 RepID=A0A7S1FZ01_9STRA|mmetsp:Transcript_43179/g.101248  ORF Transcript_43179/g.101248 Transcript_43179/m.101248 type:complete len:209 (+) Transcript_43179:224-850(+)|eukprot:CAMPEP_0113302552 /NCGR_PEP_ID=MMETSP0010_2-20120614/3326_1 /TAXON_ID=216773 ORGANISM="Corethron hystrix, Strain 308" /NCGR_SAMPLE_ID=MMETSP0010_2 /ASSEMBLY_ACC=CAM_ASM_000155 /LENGTH=208 /DNA_ID=CAMNT_0000156379 /DNA_START=112 /DNA_END=738 /DNA_ORIENTATION=+ /assembly_acc=CAM_ASM_000155